MNLFEKIQNVRCELKQKNIKMSGKNTYSNYDYFELNDFVKELNEIMLKHRMTAIPSFDEHAAHLVAFDFDSDQTLCIDSPMGSANLKGCHEVQNIGAVETYQRRYLYQAMFDIAESDALNKTQGKPEKPEKPSQKAETKEAQESTRTAKEILKSIIVNNPEEASIVKDMIDADFGGKKSKELTEEEAAQILKVLQNHVEDDINE